MSASSIASTIKSIASHCDSHKLIRELLTFIEAYLVILDESRKELLGVVGQIDDGFLDCNMLLNALPC